MINANAAMIKVIKRGFLALFSQIHLIHDPQIIFFYQNLSKIRKILRFDIKNWQPSIYAI